jgi:hypothetical protein
MLSAVAPATAAIATGLVVSAGPNATTNSVTVVGMASNVGGALVRLDVTSNDTSTAGLSANESITARVTSVPTAVTAKTLAANAAAATDSAAISSTKSDLAFVEVRGQTSGLVGTSTTAATSYTNWSTIMDRTAAGSALGANVDTPTAGSAVDGVIGSTNSGFSNMDGTKQATTGWYTKSYYMSIVARDGADVVDQGVYTVTFTMTDKDGNVRSTQTLKIDFVSVKAKSDAKLTLATSGTFIASAALASTNATGAAYATLTLTNRDGGALRSANGGVESATVSIQDLAKTPVADTMTVTSNDWGVSALDFGENTTNKNLIPQNGVYGLTGTLPSAATSATQTYQFYALYGNATPATAALTLYASAAAATNTKTDATVTAAGMSSADSLKISNDSDATYDWTLPLTTKTGSVKFEIDDANDTAVAGALITVTPTWSGTYGTAAVTPATSTTGTVYTADANGTFSVSFTNDAPVDGAVLTLVLTGGAALGTTKYTASFTWAKSKVAKISVSDPVSTVYVATGSTNVTTIKVTNQFGAAVSGESVKVSFVNTTDANYSATTVVTPIVTDASGIATYSLVGGATTATKDQIRFTSASVSTVTADMIYNYVTTLPAVSTLASYYGLSHATAGSTLVASTGVYSTGTTKLTISNARDLSKSLASFADTTSDDMVNLRFYGLTSAGVAATGAVVTVTAVTGGWILDSSGKPSTSRKFVIGTDGYTPGIQVLATKAGDIVFTATTGTVTSTVTLKTQNATADGRFITITGAATGTANGTGVPVTVSVTDRNGNPVSGVALNVVASGVGSFMGGSITNSFTTDSTGSYTFLANAAASDGGVAKFTASTGTSGDYSSLAGFVGSTEVDSTLAAGNKSASLEITFAAGASATDVAQAATDAAAEATDAANAATDAANAAAEAADAATAAAQDAADAVAALSTQVSEMIDALKKQITALTNLVIKIQKKVKA